MDSKNLFFSRRLIVGTLFIPSLLFVFGCSKKSETNSTITTRTEQQPAAVQQTNQTSSPRSRSATPSSTLKPPSAIEEAEVTSPTAVDPSSNAATPPSNEAAAPTAPSISEGEGIPFVSQSYLQTACAAYTGSNDWNAQASALQRQAVESNDLGAVCHLSSGNGTNAISLDVTIPGDQNQGRLPIVWNDLPALQLAFQRCPDVSGFVFQLRGMNSHQTQILSQSPESRGGVSSYISRIRSENQLGRTILNPWQAEFLEGYLQISLFRPAENQSEALAQGSRSDEFSTSRFLPAQNITIRCQLSPVSAE